MSTFESVFDYTPFDFVVRVNRRIIPAYPSWMNKVMHPKFGCTGPSKYDLSQVGLWLHDQQKQRGVMSGNVIYMYLKRVNALRFCFNLQDGLAIQQKGVVVFRKLFKDKALFLWKSVVQDHNDDLDVPYMYENAGRIVEYWRRLDDNWFSNGLAPRFDMESM